MSVITNDMVTNATTPAVREEFAHLLKKLSTIPDRHDRVQCYTISMETLSPTAKHVTELFSAKERQHIDHVRETMKRIPEFHADRKSHDFTKDALYFFVTSAKFACKVQGEGLDKLLALETERHYRQEAHHPQWETINSSECTRDDIREMAIDRMSRAIQSCGRVELENVERYIPVFEVGNNEEKQVWYRGFVSEHREVAENVYFDMFPEARLAN